MKICPKCRNHIILDDVSNTYWCENCRTLWAPEDLEEREDIRISILSFFAWIPIINLIIMWLNSKRRMPDKTYVNVCLSALFFHLMIAVLTVSLYVYYRDKVTQDIVGEFRASVENTITKNNLHALEIVIPDYPKIPEPNEPDIKSGVITEDMATLISGSKLLGSTVRDIILNNNNYGYLIATLAAKQKYTSASYYINVGRMFRECESDISYQWYDGTLVDVTFNYKGGEQASAWIEDPITIYYIYDSSYYTTEVLYDNKGNISGLAFIEQEE